MPSEVIVLPATEAGNYTCDYLSYVCDSERCLQTSVCRIETILRAQPTGRVE